MKGSIGFAMLGMIEVASFIPFMTSSMMSSYGLGFMNFNSNTNVKAVNSQGFAGGMIGEYGEVHGMMNVYGQGYVTPQNSGYGGYGMMGG